MPRFAANLSLLYAEFPVVERFERAARAGFTAAEFLFPYDEDIDGMRAALTTSGLTLLQINSPLGSRPTDRGIANDPRRQAEYREGIARALEIAVLFGAGALHCLSGVAVADVPADAQWATLVENTAWAAEQAAAAGISAQVEPLNTFDTPGYLLPTAGAALALMDATGHPNLRLQYDLYHSQRMEGNHTDALTRLLPRIGHIQVSETPGRRELGDGEVDFAYIFRLLDRLGYAGWVGLEYFPSVPTDASLDWLRDSGFWIA